MLPDDTKNKIKDITTGNVIQGAGDHCTAIRNFLCTSFATGRTDKAAFKSNAVIKEKQAALLEGFCKENNLWLEHLPGENQYLTRGGESKIYLDADRRNVIKINDSVYYATWLEFFNSILLHNLFFLNTTYTFLGLAKINDALHAVLKQPFVTSDTQAELEDIKALLEFNGFQNYIRFDYKNPELGLLLEDMHDENVIVNSDTLFFIDSVFYLIEPG
jgi:hypothetical protein